MKSIPRCRPRKIISRVTAIVSAADTQRPVLRWAMKLMLGTLAKNLIVIDPATNELNLKNWYGLAWPDR